MTERSFHESTLSIAGSVLLGSFIIAWAIVWAAGSHPAYQNQAPAGQAPSAPAAPQAAKDYKDIKTAGEPFIGDENAPVTIAYWFDYQCPFCKQNEQTVMPSVISDYVNTGKAKIIFKDYAFLGPDSTTLAIAARAVWEAAPDRFAAWHTAIFNDQGQEGSGWASAATISSVTTKVLGASLAAQVAALEKSNATKYQAEIDADKAEGSSYGVSGTPAFIIGGAKGTKLIVGAEPYASVKSAIDSVSGINQ